MKTTGIVRNVDALGRIVIPKELRRTLNFAEGDPLEIFTEGDQVIFRKYVVNQACAVTNEISDKNFEVNGIWFSPAGANEILKALKSNK